MIIISPWYCCNSYLGLELKFNLNRFKVKYDIPHCHSEQSFIPLKLQILVQIKFNPDKLLFQRGDWDEPKGREITRSDFIQRSNFYFCHSTNISSHGRTSTLDISSGSFWVIKSLFQPVFARVFRIWSMTKSVGLDAVILFLKSDIASIRNQKVKSKVTSQGYN